MRRHGPSSASATVPQQQPGPSQPSGPATALESWPTEWTCAVATVIFFITFALSGQMLPRLFTTPCTTQQGMCTPGPCSCAAPLERRGLVTTDAQPCFQCVQDFCPAVTEGNGTCSARPCECEDPSWPRVDVGTAHAPCWQCIHPPLDLTVRPGASGKESCLTDEAGFYTAGSRLTSASNADCGVFRYNGAVIASKRNLTSCLTWVPFGQYWGLTDCGASEPLSKFKQYTPEELAPLEMLCTGDSTEEFCVEPAEYMCTTDPTQCSMGHCRCEDPALARKEMQTVTGGVCFTCAPPLPACSVSPEPSQCTAVACECTTPGHVKVRHDSMSIVVGNDTQSCFSCRPPLPSNSGENWLSTLVTFVLCVLFGLCIGCGIRHLLPASGSDGPSRTVRGRRQADAPRTWSERWAANVEDVLLAVYDFLSDNLGDALQWARPGWRQFKSKVGDVLIAVDEAMDPLYCLLDVVQERLQQQLEAFQARIASRKAQRAAKRADVQASEDDPCEEVQEVPRPFPQESAVQRAANAVASAAARREHEAAEAAEAEEVVVPDDIDWDPLNFTGRGRTQDGNGVNVMIPKEWMKLVAAQASGTGGMAGLAGAAANASANARPGVAPSSAEAQPQQRRALRRLQQRREAASAKAAAAAVAPPPPEPTEERTPIDESWIEELESEEAAAKAKAEAKAAKMLSKKEKKKRNRGRDQTEKAQGKECNEPEEEDVHAVDEGDTAAGPLSVEEELPAEEEQAPTAEPKVEESSDVAPAPEQGPESLQAPTDNAEAAEQEAALSASASAAPVETVHAPSVMEALLERLRFSAGLEENPAAAAALAAAAAAAASTLEGAGASKEKLLSEAVQHLLLLSKQDGSPTSPGSTAVPDAQAAIAQEGTVPESPKSFRADADEGAGASAVARKPKASAHQKPKEDKSTSRSAELDADSGAGVISPAATSTRFMKQSDILRKPWRQQQRQPASENDKAAAESDASEKSLVSPADAGAGARSKAKVPEVKSIPAAKATMPEKAQSTAAKKEVGPPTGKAVPKQRGAAPATLGEPETSRCQAFAKEAPRAPPVAKAKAPPVPSEPSPAPWRKAAAKATTTSGSSAPPAKAGPAVPEPAPVPSKRPEKPAQPDPPAEPASAITAEVQLDCKADVTQPKLAHAEEAGAAAVPADSSSESATEQEMPGPADAQYASTPWMSTSKPLAADAPDFVPLAMMQPQPVQTDPMQMEGRDRGGRKGRKGRQQQHADQLSAAGDSSDAQSVPITTMMISGIQAHHTAESFRQQLDSWGLLGTYNFYFMPSEKQTHLTCGYAFINFIDPTFATLCQWLFQQYQFEGAATPFQIQGLESNIAHWNQFADDTMDMPVIIPTPTPSQWAVNGVNVMLNSKFSPQIREQFHKTKMCVFYRKNKCALGMSCPFAHTKEELQPPPDLAKTKLCYNFFRRRCNDSKCKFAHGYQELRATETVYKTELCRWWSAGGCKAGGSCRYAHGVEELRVPQMEMPGGFPFMPPEGFMESEDGDMFPAMMMPAMAGMQGFDDADGQAVHPMHMASSSKSKWLASDSSAAAGSGKKNSLESAERPSTKGLSGAAARSSKESTVDPEPTNGDDGASDMGFSDTSTLLAGSTQLLRQSTAPASSYRAGVPQLTERSLNDGVEDIVLRVKGTFMEAIHVDSSPAHLPIHRSWSDGDLPQLREVMEGMESGDEL